MHHLNNFCQCINVISAHLWAASTRSGHRWSHLSSATLLRFKKNLAWKRQCKCLSNWYIHWTTDRSISMVSSQNVSYTHRLRGVLLHIHTIGSIYYNWDLCNGVPYLATSWVSHTPKMTDATKWFHDQLSATMWPRNQRVMRRNGNWCDKMDYDLQPPRPLVSYSHGRSLTHSISTSAITEVILGLLGMLLIFSEQGILERMVI